MGDCSKAVCSGLELTVAVTVCTRPAQDQASQVPSRLGEGSHEIPPLPEEWGESVCFQEEASEKLPVPPENDPILMHILVVRWNLLHLKAHNMGVENWGSVRGGIRVDLITIH